MELPDAFGYATFCDDIREELSHKFVFVGVYRGALLIKKDFPISLNNFAIHVAYFERTGVRNEPLNLQVYFPGDSAGNPTVSLPVSIEKTREIESQRSFASKTQRGDRIFRSEVVVRLSPLEIKASGSIRVLMKCGDDEIELGVLRVDKANEKE